MSQTPIAKLMKNAVVLHILHSQCSKIHLAKLIFGEIRHSNHREIYIPIIEARLYIRLPTTARQKVSQLSGKTCTTITTLPLKVVHVQGAQTSLE